MTGYTTSMLYVDEERFTRDSNIFIEPPKPIDECNDIANNNDGDFEKNRNKNLISLYTKTKQLIHTNFKLEQLCNNERISTIEIKNIFTELFDDTICINELIYECIKHS